MCCFWYTVDDLTGKKRFGFLLGCQVSIIFSFDKNTNVLDDKKEAVVTTPFSQKKLLTTENVTTSYEVHKCTAKITTSEYVAKVTDKFHKPP